MRHNAVYAHDESVHKAGIAGPAVGTGAAAQAQGLEYEGFTFLCRLYNSGLCRGHRCGSAEGLDAGRHSPVLGPGFRVSCHWRRCGSAEGLDAGRLCLRKWGFRRCEDICWIKTNVSQERRSALRPDAHSVLQHTKVKRP